MVAWSIFEGWVDKNRQCKMLCMTIVVLEGMLKIFIIDKLDVVTITMKVSSLSRCLHLLH